MNATVYRSTINSVTEFQAHLQRNEVGYGLIYMSCHGGYENQSRKFWLGLENNENQRLWLASLRTCHLLKTSPSIVFINACHSGRHQCHPLIKSSYRRSFIEFFLRKGAHGVLGTLGEVGDNYAAKFAQELLKNVTREPETPFATILRKLRLRIIENLPNEPTEEQLTALIYTFMYVYYGNPMTVLRLSSSGGQAHV
jgi:hypothetical protein